jgi:protein TonB
MRALAHAERQATYLEETSPVGSMKIRSAEAPTYPRDALVAEITGWVDLNFTVDEQGVTRDIVVVAAEPPERFDDAAIEAVSRYEFEPFVEDGELYARRIRARVRFQLN